MKMVMNVKRQIMGLVLGGALTALGVGGAGAAPADSPAGAGGVANVIANAQKLETSDALGAVKMLKAAAGTARDAGERATLQAALIDAYIAQGRPMEAASEGEQWLKENPKNDLRAHVLWSMVEADRGSSDFNGAASLCRVLLTEYPNSPDKQAILDKLIDIAMYGQQNGASEALALADRIAAFPNDPDNDMRMLRLARVQEWAGDPVGAAATLVKFAQQFPQNPHAPDHYFYAGVVLNERASKPADALKVLQAYFTAFPKAVTASQANYVETVARNLQNVKAELDAAVLAMQLDPKDGDAPGPIVDDLQHNVDKGTISLEDLQRLETVLAKSFPGDLDIRVRSLLSHREAQVGKYDFKAAADQAMAHILQSQDDQDLQWELEDALNRQAAVDKSDARAKAEDFYKNAIPKIGGETRYRTAMRYHQMLVEDKKWNEAAQIWLGEMKANPSNRREFGYLFITDMIESQRLEIQTQKRAKFDLKDAVAQYLPVAKDIGMYPEVRHGMQDAEGALNQAGAKDEAAQLHAFGLQLAADPIVKAVDAIILLNDSDPAKALDAMGVLQNSNLPNKLNTMYLLGGQAFHVYDKAPELRGKTIQYLKAWSDLNPGDKNLARETGWRCWQAGDSAGGLKYLTSAMDTDNPWILNATIGNLMDMRSADPAAMDQLAAVIDKDAGLLNMADRVQRYRQMAGMFAARKDVANWQKAMDFDRKAGLGFSDCWPSARDTLNSLPADQAVALGKKWMDDPSLASWHPAIGLLMANKIMWDQKDLAGALAIVQKSLRIRDCLGGYDSDDTGMLRYLTYNTMDFEYPARVNPNDASRKKQLEGFKHLSPEQIDDALNVTTEWYNSTTMHEMGIEKIRRFLATQRPAQAVEAFAELAARTNVPENPDWYWNWTQLCINEAMTAKQPGVATTMMRIVLKMPFQYGDGRMDALRQAMVNQYDLFGDDLGTIDDKGVLAPLIHGVSYLRLGEEKRAWQAYVDNKDLFSKNIDIVPSDLVLFVTNELSMGSDDDRDLAETLLRTWLARTQPKPNDTRLLPDASVKAAISLKLADVFYNGQRFDVARAEYQNVIDTYPDTPQSTEAQFRIGESFIYQKNYAEATKVFERLRKSKDAEVSTRAVFMTGVLNYTKGSRDEAMDTFKSVLDMAPSEDLASKALFQLSLIYRDESRFHEMLDMLQTIGRLGRVGKKWHTPGQPLIVMIQDPDLAIVQTSKTVPVLVTTTGGDRELVNLTVSAAGRGIFMAELPTALGTPKPGDGVLQLLGSDVITYDYPEEFKKRFRNAPPPKGTIKIASDATFTVSSKIIQGDDKNSVLARANVAGGIQRAADVQQDFRSIWQFKPGNSIYVRVEDADSSLKPGINFVEVALKATSGDSVLAQIPETGPNTGIFAAAIPTADRSASLFASDNAMNHPASLAGDSDPGTDWQSQHDAAQGKWIAADLGQSVPVEQVKFESDPAHAPALWMLEASNDGQDFLPVASNVSGVSIAHGLAMEYGAMRHWDYGWSKIKGLDGLKGTKPPTSMQQYIAMLAAKLPDGNSQPVQSFLIPDGPRDPEMDIHVTAGYFYAPIAGKYEFGPRPNNTGSAFAIDGQEYGWGNGVEVPLTVGWHRLASFITVLPDYKGQIGMHFWYPGQGGSWKDEVPQPPQGVVMPLPAKIAVVADPKVTSANGSVTVDVADLSARFLRLDIMGYSGDYVSVHTFGVNGPGAKTYLPIAEPKAVDGQQVLHVQPGDGVDVSYVDRVNTSPLSEPRVLSTHLTATYFDGTVVPIAYDIVTSTSGVARIRKELARIDPGERIVASITDYDEDVTAGINKVPFTVHTDSGAEMKLEASETWASSGNFTKEIDTYDAEKPPAGDNSGKLPVKRGELVYIAYNDKLNTNPGHPMDRVTSVEVVKPTDGTVNVLPTRVQPVPDAPAGSPQNGGEGDPTLLIPKITYLAPVPGKPSEVALAAPLTVEVFDPDMAKDSHSSVTVDVTTTSGAKLTVPLELSDAPAVPGGPSDHAIVTGRFVGQALLVLGEPGTEKQNGQIISIEQAQGLIGAWRYGQQADSQTGSVAAPVLAITGKDEITVTYHDTRNTTGKPVDRIAKARLVTDGILSAVDRKTQKPITSIHLGEKLYLRLEDADRDVTSDPDTVEIELTTKSGGKMPVKLTETLGHSGVFTAEVQTHYSQNFEVDDKGVGLSFGDVITLSYIDELNTQGSSPITRTATVQVAHGSDAVVSAFTKQFSSEEMAVETQFKLAECYFELFKSQKSLKQEDQATQSLEAGRAILKSLQENYRGSPYEARVLYLLGNFHEELKEFDAAIADFQTIIRTYGNNTLAPDAQYKLGQCFEGKGDMDRASEEYVRLAYTYPDSPLIAKCMVRLVDYYYKSEQYLIAAEVCRQFLDQYPDHEWAPQIAFRQGQAYYKAGEAVSADENAAKAKGINIGAVTCFTKAATSFDYLTDHFPNSDLRADSLFWAGQSYAAYRNEQLAYRRYRRVTWDFPDSDAAKFARGQLTKPDMMGEAEADTKQPDQ